MAKSIFEKMESIQEVNRMAGELRRLGMKEKLKELADKNQVMDEDLKAFFLGKRYFLVDAGETQKTYDTSRAKLMDEMLTLNDPLFGNVICGVLLQCCGEPDFQEAVLQEHKTLQRCIEYVMEQAYGLLDENQKKARRDTAVAVVSDQVFEWAKGYYAVDDKAALEEKRKKAATAFQNRNKPKGSKAAGKGTSKKKTTKAAKTPRKHSGTAAGLAEPEAGTNMGDSEKGMEVKTATDRRPENTLAGTEIQTAERGQIEGQVSMFAMGSAV